MPIQDTLQRPVRDLRISVTDRCNLRCGYCMPRDVFGPEYKFLDRKELLTYEETTTIARIFARIGVRKIRLTGGEPLLRRDLPLLIEMLAAIEGIEDLSLTTNGVLLKEQARAIKEAGLQRVTVSLDSLDPEIFRAMSDVEVSVDAVLKGIEAAENAGLGPIKINAVVRRGMNVDGVVDLARKFHGTGHIVRFIEYMDVGNTNGWKLNEVVPAREILDRIHAELPLEPVQPSYKGEVARRWKYRDGGGEIGVIASVTQPFCSDCSRARLSPEGKLFTCLFASGGHDLRKLLRDGASEEEIFKAASGIWLSREDRYSEVRSSMTSGLPKVEMSYIGG
jgi:cyclic pyranopterin phosphate synthase